MAIRVLRPANEHAEGEMKSDLLGFAVALTLLMVSGSTAATEDRVEVGVVFEVQAQHFTNGFDPEQVADFTAKSSDAIARALERHIRFVTFTTNTAAAYRLHVLLANPEKQDAPGISSFGFHLDLTGPDVPPSAKSYVEFRSIDRFFESIGSVDALAREIEEAINKLDHRAFVATFLSEIPIADNAEFRKNQTSWVVERDRLALCIGYQSLLRVLSQVPFGDQMRREWFLAKVIDIPSEPTRIFAETTDDPGGNARLLRDVDEAKVKVERVAISDYLLCQAPVPASDVSFPDTGGDQ
jgi:hypothetical protein